MAPNNSGIVEVYDRNQEATIYVGNIDTKIDEELVWELFTQAGPLQSVHLPKDRITNMHQGFAFVEFKTEEDCDYAIKIMNMVKLFGKPIRCTKATADQRRNNQDVGANLFVGNLDPLCDDKTLYECFASFGQMLFAKVMKDPDTAASRGFGFVSYDSFEASDAALMALNGQFLCNSVISVSYARKGTSTERHGSAAERLIADQTKQQQRADPIVGHQGHHPGLGGVPGMMHPGMPGMPGQFIPPPPPQMMNPGQGLQIPQGPGPTTVPVRNALPPGMNSWGIGNTGGMSMSNRQY